jgi:DNA invertase Pin-like site-specific DNA recombinase
MMKASKNNEFDLILVWKIDRFFRKTLYLLEYVEYLIDF